MYHYRKHAENVIGRNFPHMHGDILSATEANYAAIAPEIAFARTSPNPIDKRLDFCAYFLALIQVLDARHESYDNIRRICLEIVSDYVRPKNRMQRMLKRIPPMLIGSWLARFLLTQLNKRLIHPNERGFVARIITDPDETFGLGYGVDILECGICKLFNNHNYSRYASILCDVDEITSGLAGLKLVRSGTIAGGAEKCDFRFKRQKIK